MQICILSPQSAQYTHFTCNIIVLYIEQEARLDFMNIDILLALMLFAFASSVTPGPNNLMLMASGVNFGFRLTLPHMLGVSLGFAFMAILVGVGIMQVFDAYPISYILLKIFSVCYLLYLAFKIATASGSIGNVKVKAQPMTFIQAVAFQWVNPKAWSMALTAVSVYAPNKDLVSIVLVATVFSLVNFPCIACWAGLGSKIKLYLTKPSRLKAFNYFMAGLLVASLYPVLI